MNDERTEMRLRQNEHIRGQCDINFLYWLTKSWWGKTTSTIQT